MDIRNTILNTSFGKNYFVSAIGGCIVFGPVKLNCGVLQYEKNDYFCVFHKKFQEFLQGLQVLGANIVIGEKKTVEIETSKNEFIHFKDKKLMKFINHEEILSIEFDQFMYLDFVSSLANIVIFVTNPTTTQYHASQEYLKLVQNSEANFDELITVVCAKLKTESTNEELLLSQYMKLHKHILIFLVEVRKIANLT